MCSHSAGRYEWRIKKPFYQTCCLTMVWNIVRQVNSMSLSSLGDDRHTWGKRLSGIHKTSHPTALMVTSAFMLSHISHTQLCELGCESYPTTAIQDPVSMRFSRQEYWNACHFLLQGIFQPRDWTHILYVSCTCRQVLYHCTTLEALFSFFFFFSFANVTSWWTFIWDTNIFAFFAYSERFVTLLPQILESQSFQPYFIQIANHQPNHWPQPTHCGINHTSGHFSFQSVALL